MDAPASFTPAASMPQPPASGPPTSRSYAGLALGSLVFGIFAVLLGFVLIGLALGIAHLVKAPVRSGRAWAGVLLSGFGLVISLAMVGLTVWLVQVIQSGRVVMGKETLASQWRGKPAPPLEIVTLDGQRIRLRDLRGRRVVLNFWATWCGPCRRELPHFVELAQETPDDQITVIGLSAEDESELRPFIEENGVTYAVASVDKRSLPPPYGQVRSVPTTMIIDRNGTIQFITVGYLTRDKLRKLATAPDLHAEMPPIPPPPPRPKRH
jgi:peroxiredoxin